MEQVQGQERAIDVLQTQLAADRVHHAYIFHGPAGVGKFTTALIFAQVLLCHEPQTDLTGRVVACGTCRSCQLLQRTVGGQLQRLHDTTRLSDDDGDRPRGKGKAGGKSTRARRGDAADAPDADDPADAGPDTPTALGSAHPDLHVVTKELARYSDDKQVRDRKLTRIPVDVLRQHLIEPVYRAAQLRHGKVFILDEAELLNLEGQNLLLKTLEEPPAGTTIMLVTSSEDRLLPTIRSRCQRVAFVPLPDEVIERWVAERAGDLIERDRRWLVRFAQGSLGRAQLAVQYGLNEWAAQVLPALERLAQGRPTGELGSALHQRIDGFAQTWVKHRENASKEAANKLAADLMLSLIADEARQRLAQLAEACDPADPVAGEAAMAPWLGVIDAVEHAQRLLASNVNLGMVCDHLVSAMTRQLVAGRR